MYKRTDTIPSISLNEMFDQTKILCSQSLGFRVLNVEYWMEMYNVAGMVQYGNRQILSGEQRPKDFYPQHQSIYHCSEQ